MKEQKHIGNKGSLWWQTLGDLDGFGDSLGLGWVSHGGVLGPGERWRPNSDSSNARLDARKLRWAVPFHRVVVVILPPSGRRWRSVRHPP